MILVGLYVFFLAAFIGTMRYTSTQIILLLTGIVSVTVFSYMHLNYAGKNPEEFACPILPGIFITVICLTPGLIFIPVLVSCSNSHFENSLGHQRPETAKKDTIAIVFLKKRVTFVSYITLIICIIY